MPEFPPWAKPLVGSSELGGVTGRKLGPNIVDGRDYEAPQQQGDEQCRGGRRGKASDGLAPEAEG